MSIVNAQQDEFPLLARIADATRILEGLEEKLRALDDELNTHASRRLQYQLLGSICISLDKLDEMGASELFWDSKNTGYSPEKQLQRVRNAVAGFEHKIAAIEGVRSGVLAEIERESLALSLLNDELAELEDEAESIRNELVIEREAAVLPFRPMVMPWSKQGEDERRYRKIMLFVLLGGILFGILVWLFNPPAVKREETVIDEKIAELVVKKKQEPKPVENKPAENPVEREGSTSTDARQARDVAQTKGVLALKGGLADLIDSAETAKFGADARVSNGGRAAVGDSPRRSVIGSQAQGGSGGINTSGLNRQGGGVGGGQSITGSGVRFARVESATGAGVADDRPLSKGAGPSRTDEEIQIVFDRYKAALYRIYNRELRNDPTLRGKMVLRLTIEPDGRVSSCSVKSTDMASLALSAEVVDRVLKFNFGPKDRVPALTILYPIDFLPAS